MSAVRVTLVSHLNPSHKRRFVHPCAQDVKFRLACLLDLTEEVLLLLFREGDFFLNGGNYSLSSFSS
jgi:hypothetical protein